MKVAQLRALPIKLLIYSRAGLGKTALALTLGEDCLYLDMDDNMEVAFGLKDQYLTDRQCVEVEQFIDYDRTKALAFMNLRKRIIKISNDCMKGTFEYKYVVVDSLTSLALSAQHQCMVNASKGGQNPQIQHWGWILNEILQITTMIRALPVVVLVLAHETTFTADDVSVIQIAISGQKLPGQITRMFNEIWYLRAKATGGGAQTLYIQTVPTSSITCRSGRGLPTGTPYAMIDKSGKPVGSVGMKDLLAMIDRKDKEPATAKLKTE